jgi:uncharacterized protein (TIGR02271 family)
MHESDATRVDQAIGSKDQVIPLLEEVAEVEKRQASAGKVRIRTAIDTIDEKVSADLEGVEVDVRRVPVDRVVTEVPRIRTEGDTTIVPVVEEILFVEKRLVLKEELHIIRRTTTETVEIPVTLRKERASIERVASDNGNTSEEKDR